MSEATPLLLESGFVASIPTFTHAIQSEKGRFPQAIAHRGYKAEFPENTLRAFEGAVAVGAHALETDVHITKDGVVVLSHDASLKRCFGRDEQIIDCEWDFIKTLRSIREPKEPMPRLKDLLLYLKEPGLEEIWVLLDIKLDNSSDDVFRLIANTLTEIDALPGRPWNKRILLGCWAATQLAPCIRCLPDYHITHIGVNTIYARQFLKVPGLSFNMLQKIMTGYLGKRFLRDIKKDGRAIFLWTVNDEGSMKWSIRKQVDGVITDDPKKYLEVCKAYDGTNPRMKWQAFGLVILYQALAVPVNLLLRLKFGGDVDAKKIALLLGESRKHSSS